MRRLFLGFIVLLLVVMLGMGGIAYYFSGVALAVDHTADYSVKVLRASTASVTLARTHDDVLPGTYGISWNGGRAVVTAITSSDTTSVTRLLQPGDGAPPVGVNVAWDENVYAGDPLTARGVAFQTVNVSTPLGAMPAWFVPGRSSTWMIFVHGHNATREAGLRYIPALQGAGYPVLDVTYRNDASAPSSSDKKDHLGATEWHDVDSAISYAKANGATGVVLYGSSMGGAMSMETLRHSSQADLIRGVVLDSPVMDWRNTLDKQGGDQGLPLFETRLAEKVFSERSGMNLDDFDQVRHAASLKVPVLLFIGSEDDYVPSGPSIAFAKAQPKLVILVTTQGASHTDSWNVDPIAYEQHLTDFLHTAAP